LDFLQERIAVIFFLTFSFFSSQISPTETDKTLFIIKKLLIFLAIAAVAFSIDFDSLHLSSSFFR